MQRSAGVGDLQQRVSRHVQSLALEAQEENRPPLWSSLVGPRARIGEWTVSPRSQRAPIETAPFIGDFDDSDCVPRGAC
jgi:hypothetical protein